MINKTNSLSFNLRWDELETFLKGFTSDLDLKILAGIQHAAALSHRSRKDEALEVLNGLVPNALLANNGQVQCNICFDSSEEIIRNPEIETET